VKAKLLKGSGVGVVLLVLLLATVSWMSGDQQDLPGITVYKSQWCGCCTQWVAHMRDNGFEVKVEEMNDLSLIKARYSVTSELSSCHTAVVDGYVVEGHVPADLVKRLLRDRPDVVGLAVPGMPIGSPGMEGPNKEAYDVLTFDDTGATSVYARR
jgi:hypothetical protein